MRFAYEASFWKSTVRLSLAERHKIVKAVTKFERALEAGAIPAGLGFTHLREDFFEFRVGIHKRIIFQRGPQIIRYVIYGSHDDVVRLLKRL